MTSNRQVAGRFARRIAGCHGKLTCVVGLLMLLTGVMNGIGILLLLPLLHAAGISDGAPIPSATGLNEAQPFTIIGFPLRLPWVMLAFFVLSLTNALLNRWLGILNTRLKEDAVFELRTELFAAVHRASWLFLVGRGPAEFTHALTDSLKRVAAGILQALRLASATIVAAMQIGASVLIAPWLSAVALAAGLCLWPLLRRQNEKVADIGKTLTTNNHRFYAELGEQLSGLKEAKALCSEEAGIVSFEQHSHRLRDSHMQLTTALANTGLIYAAGATALLGGLLLFSQLILKTPLTSLIALIIVFTRVFPRLREIHSGTLQIVHMLPAFAVVIELLEQCQQNQEAPLAPHQDLKIRHCVELRNVSFAYSSRAGQPALDNIDLVIRPGESIYIIGPSGSGKSTLVDILLTLLPPCEGTLLLDGEPLNPRLRTVWRQKIGYVPQDTFLFHDTIRANLLRARPDANDEDLAFALTLAAAADFVQSLPLGLDTVVGDRGTCLSGGERQRIALARAILREPSILVLDEATSAIDSENQNRIHEAIKRLRVHKPDIAVVTITHNLTSVDGADHIYVLDGGRIEESGSPDELAARAEGRFARMLQATRRAAA